jgi:hypothetical protein
MCRAVKAYQKDIAAPEGRRGRWTLVVSQLGASLPAGSISVNENIAYMDPPRAARAFFAMAEEADCTHISGLNLGGRAGLLAMMESALFRLNSFSTCASTVSAITRVWKSRSDLSCHHYLLTHAIGCTVENGAITGGAGGKLAWARRQGLGPCADRPAIVFSLRQ